MSFYSIIEIAEKIDRNPSIVEEWFERLENDSVHYVQRKNGEKYYDSDDLEIALLISKKRDSRWTYDRIIEQIKADSLGRQIPPEEVLSQGENNKDYNTPLYPTSPLDPESLFYQIAQDNEVIKVFKYHSIRVMYLASMLAKRVGCFDEDLRIAALLHDIGKMGLSKEILLKPGKLNDLEFTIIQSHSHMGNVIVRKHLGLTRAARFIRDHHERWDGTGYPRRLVGDEISIQGRIIAIIDAFDSMTYDRRNYKERTINYDEAIYELERCSWTQFDGALVKVFSQMIENVEIPEYMFNVE